MPLGLTVSLLVLGGIVLAGIAGYLIEKSPEAKDTPERSEDRRNLP